MSDVKEEIKAALESVRSKVGAEIADKIEDDLISLTTKTNSIVTQSKEFESEVKQLRAEAYDKRHQLKDSTKQFESELSQAKDKITELEAATNDTELTTKIERLEKFEKETYENQRNEFKSFIETNKEHERFEKVVGRFKVPTNDDGIDFDAFGTMEHEDLKHNISQMKDLLELEYFDQTPTNNSSPPVGGRAQRGSDKTFAEKMAAAKTQKEVTAVIEAEGVK